MSGGAWNYLSYKMGEAADEAKRLIGGFELLAAIEHEMDWGISCDTCYDCAKLRVIAALETYFGDGASSPKAAIAVARDSQQNECPECAERRRKRKGDQGATAVQ